MIDETPERYFFKYAFPCAFLKLERGEITKKEYDRLEKKFLGGSSVRRSKLERIFKPAFNRIKRLATRMQKYYWEFDVIKEYWLNEHNRLIDKNDGDYKFQTNSFKDLCGIHRATIIEKKENSFIVRYNKKKREVYSAIVPYAKKGDTVTIHFSYAIEKI